jgi:YXWGXW repeat-containing protein
MSKLILTRLAAALIAAGTVGACASNPRPRVGVEYVRRGPPAERVEVIPMAPGREYVWVKGHWAWRRNDYVWEPGRWVVPERGYRTWEPGHWQHDRGGWFYVEGRWR